MIDHDPMLSDQAISGTEQALAKINSLMIDLQEKNQQLTMAYEEFATAHIDVIKNRRLDHELQVARRIQQGILPQKLPEVRGYDFGVRMALAQMVGGDFFDFIPLGKNELGIAIGDVTDKGVPASILMAVTRALLRAEAHHGIQPEQVLSRVNYHLSDMNEEGLFVTVLYGILNIKQHTFTYARAGHELPLLIDMECHTACIERGAGQALGIFPHPEFDEQQINLQPGSMMLLNTDGVSDAIDASGVAFGIDRLEEAVRASMDISAQAVCDKVIEAVTTFQGSTPQFDDITLVGVKLKELA
jgi:phosphoserine phosphatase RsbU/P